MFPRFLLWISVAAVVTAQDSSSLTTPSGGAGYQPITAEGRMKSRERAAGPIFSFEEQFILAMWASWVVGLVVVLS